MAYYLSVIQGFNLTPGISKKPHFDPQGNGHFFS